MLFSLKSRKKDEKKQEEKDKNKDDQRKNVSKMEDLTADFNFINSDTPVRKVDRTEKKEMALDFISDFGSELLDTSGPQAPPRARKTAGWSDDTPGKKSWLRRGSKNFLKESPKKVMPDSPVSSEIPVIPDLDDMKEEELSSDIAKAPSLTVSRIATYQELDSDLSKHSAFQSLDGIDLTLLTKRLLPEQLVKKEDETSWTWDTLFADVSSNLNAAMSNEQNETNAMDRVGKSS